MPGISSLFSRNEWRLSTCTSELLLWSIALRHAAARICLIHQSEIHCLLRAFYYRITFIQNHNKHRRYEELLPSHLLLLATMIAARQRPASLRLGIGTASFSTRRCAPAKEPQAIADSSRIGCLFLNRKFWTESIQPVSVSERRESVEAGRVTSRSVLNFLFCLLTST